MDLKIRGCLLFVIFLFSALQAIATQADTRTVLGPYKVHNSKILDYEFSYPLNPAYAPVVQVHQRRGVFDTIIRDRDINFKFRYRFECGKGWKLHVTESPGMKGCYPQDRGVENGLRILDFTMPEYVPPIGQDPISACNAVIRDRKDAGLATGKLLRKGYWVTLLGAYPMQMGYRCEEKKLVFGTPPRNYSPKISQPLYAQCLGDPDFDKPVARTSKNTSTTSASRDDIAEALEKKRKKREAEQRAEAAANRTNPEGSGSTRTNASAGTGGKRVNPEGAREKGLVYQALIETGNIKQRVSPPKKGVEIIKIGKQMVSREFQLADIEIKKLNGKHHYIGLWNKTGGASWFSALTDLNNFNDIRDAQRKKGMRLLDFETVKSTAGAGGRLYSGVWSPGAGKEFMSSAVPIATFRKLLKDKMANETMIAVDFEIERGKNGSLKYRGLWRSWRGMNVTPRLPEQMDDVQLSTPVPLKEYGALRKKLNGAGKRAIDIERLNIGGKPHVAALWVSGTGKSIFTAPRKPQKFLNFIKSQEDMIITDLEVVKVKQ